MQCHIVSLFDFPLCGATDVHTLESVQLFLHIVVQYLCFRSILGSWLLLLSMCGRCTDIGVVSSLRCGSMFQSHWPWQLPESPSHRPQKKGSLKAWGWCLDWWKHVLLYILYIYIYIYPSSPPLFKQRGRDVDLLLQTTTIFQVDCSGWQRGEAILAPGQCKALKGLLWHMFWSTLSCIRSSMFKTHDGLIEIWNRDTVPRTDNGTDKWEKWYITYPTVDAMGLTCHEASLGNPLIA